jgi:hypothetical protein
VYFVVILYILWLFGIFLVRFTMKNLATLLAMGAEAVKKKVAQKNDSVVVAIKMFRRDSNAP